MENKNNEKLNKVGLSESLSIDESNKRRTKKFALTLRTQFIIACILTGLALVIVPVTAWFAFQNEIAVSTKVNSPATLEIRAGGEKGKEQSIINFDLSDIDTEDASYNHYTDESGATPVTYYYKDFVFCVKGKAISQYDLQLAHTTNIAFKYDIYRAEQDNNGTIIYTSLDKTVTQKYKLISETPLDGAYVNNASSAGERVIAKYGNIGPDTVKDLTSRSYIVGRESGNDTFQKYANPAYWLKRGIPVSTEEKTDEGFTHSYVLRVSWIMVGSLTPAQREENLDDVQNNKETDMIYITAAVN